MINDELSKNFLIALENCTRPAADGCGALERLDALLAVAAEVQAQRKAEASRLAIRQPFDRTRRERILGYFIIFILFAGVLYVLHRTGFPLRLPSPR